MQDLRGIDLNLLVDLDALLNTRSVTEAARRLNLSQSAMSGSLARLRRLFDDPLMVKSGRGLTLTSRAEALIPSVQEALISIGVVFDNEKDTFVPSTATRYFSISASDYATAVVLGPLIRTLSAEAPNVTINVLPRTADVQTFVRLDRADLIIEPRETMGPTSLPSTPLFTDRWLCMLDGEMHDPSVLDDFDLDYYLTLPHMVYSIGNERQLNLADRHLASLGIERRVELTIESFLMAPLLIRGTSLACLVLERSTAMQRMDGLKLVEPPISVPDIHEEIYWNPRHTNDPGHRWLRARVAATAAALEPVSRTEGDGL
ncbi:LysR family transcriptional regulator [Rhodococcus sp. JS3073]|uniref:LysR family transcriptional regulator n=1 Tax=Rhodococcus sp. JS3073 TaxID=3002901 RepID=UPI0022863C97|nr:LysR family transcriptional regulator [Rhodococcus sp. JS3073]WAM19949.1 LysR family transcriptional regulator [Rhodococcus sp. JS3073]